MIEAIEVDGFRGLRRLKVEGIGRVNLIIGRNDSGKTALMEAIAVATTHDPGAQLAQFQAMRNQKLPVADFNRFWAPLFWNHAFERGLTTVVRFAGGRERRIRIHKVEAPPDIVTTTLPRPGFDQGNWGLELMTEEGDREHKERIDATVKGVKFPSPSEPEVSYWAWIQPNRNISDSDVRSFSKIKQEGREAQLIDIMKQVDPRITGIELLAPTGIEAELFVRFAPSAPLLGIGMMGDGFQRCFEFAVTFVAANVQKMYVDEFENGIHHSVIEPVWRQCAEISLARGLQIFATTHSEECVQAACRAFTAAGDDGLRVIRLDQREDETVAMVYDRSLVEAATRMGVEIRG